MRLLTMDPLLRWLEDFRNLNLSSESESDTAKFEAEHEMPAEETPPILSQESISPRRILSVFSVTKSAKLDGGPHSTVSSNLTSRSITKPKSSGQQAQAMSALSDRGYMKLAAKKCLNIQRRKNKRKISLEDDQYKGVRAIGVFNPKFYANLMHGDYEKRARIQTPEKLNQRRWSIPVSKTPKGTRINRVFPRGLDISHRQLVDNFGPVYVNPKYPLVYFGFVQGDPLSKYGLTPAGGTSEQIVNESPRVTAAMLVAESASDPQVLFAPFRLLPTELRLHIWSLARPEPRIVRVLHSKYYPATFSKTPIPSMLHACRESRETALKWYKLRFRRCVDYNEIISMRFNVPRTYFDFENDVFYTGCKNCRRLMCWGCKSVYCYPDSDKIQRLLLHWEGNLRVPYFSLCVFFPAAQYVMILGAGNNDARPESRFDQLVKSNAPFLWQKKPTLQED